MFKLLKLFSVILCLGFLVFAAAPVEAQTSLLPSPDECDDASYDRDDPSLACCIKYGNCTLENGVALFARVGQFILGIVGSLVLAVFVYGGFLWLTSAGNPDKVSKGRKAMMGAVVGLLIVFGAYIIVINVQSILRGGEVTDSEATYVVCDGTAETEGLDCDLNSQCVSGSCMSECAQYNSNKPENEPDGFCADKDTPGVTGCVSDMCPGGADIQCCEWAQ